MDKILFEVQKEIGEQKENNNVQILLKEKPEQKVFFPVKSI